MKKLFFKESARLPVVNVAINTLYFSNAFYYHRPHYFQSFTEYFCMYDVIETLLIRSQPILDPRSK